MEVGTPRMLSSYLSLQSSSSNASDYSDSSVDSFERTTAIPVPVAPEPSTSSIHLAQGLDRMRMPLASALFPLLVMGGTAEQLRDLLDDRSLLRGLALDSPMPQANGIPPLFFVLVVRPDAAKVTVLLEAGANADAAGPRGTRPLMLAAGQSLMGQQMVESVLRFGAPVDARSDIGETALHATCRYHRRPEQIIPQLLAAGAKTDALNTRGGQPLHLLCECSPTPLAAMRLLLDHGAIAEAPTGSGRLPQHLLMEFCAMPLGPLLLLQAHGADLRATMPNGYTLLHLLLAFRPGDVTTCRYLLKQKIDVNAVGGSQARSALHLLGENADKWQSSEILAVLKLLKKHGAKFAMRNAAGLTPLATLRQEGAPDWLLGLYLTV
jgi:ankyrin repeat protein